MCKAFESDPSLLEDEPQAEAGEEPAIQPSPLKRKGKEVDAGGSRKKAKLSVSLRMGGDLNIGGEDNPPSKAPRRVTRSAALASLLAAQSEPRARASPRQAVLPSSSPGPTTRSA